MYVCPHTGAHSFGVIHFIGEDGASSYSPEYFAEHSEHIALETATDGEAYVLYQADYSFGTFTGV